MNIYSYILVSLLIALIYLVVRYSVRKRMSFDASEMYFLSWFISLFLMLLELEGCFYDDFSADCYSVVSEYIFYLSIAAFAGFGLSNIFSKRVKKRKIKLNLLDEVLVRFKWVLYLSLLIGVLQFIYLITHGAWGSFEHYRIVAVTLKRTGYGAVLQQLSGHVSVLCTFYIILFAIKQSLTGVLLRPLIVNIILFSSINVSIGGRAWIVSSIIPYIVAYFYGKQCFTAAAHYDDRIQKQSYKRLVKLCGILFAAFSIIGMWRGGESNFLHKFLYYTDGPKVANIVLEKYPSGSYDLDYGRAQTGWFGGSKMHNKYLSSIKDNIGLSVTVPSCIPYLYYDFGYRGGILFWFTLCFLIGILMDYTKKNISLFTILLYCAVSRAFFSTPVGCMFPYMIIVIEWILITYFLIIIFGKKKYLSLFA